MTYREHRAPRTAAATVACLWTQTTTSAEQSLVPDAAVDVLWFDDGRLVVAGADTGPVVDAVPVGARVVGVRLRPEAAGAVLGLDASELTDRRVDGADLDLPGLARLAATPPSHAALLDALAAATTAPDRLVAGAAALLARPGARVAAVADTLGVSSRHLQRRVCAAVGYGPKTLARVLRLNALRTLPAGDLAALALRAGYAGQAHMNDEVRRLTGVTPVRFLEDRGSAAP
ncbi:helix-turn-helix domain-containing protein [Jatrophihabitans fulvus]